MEGKEGVSGKERALGEGLKCGDTASDVRVAGEREVVGAD